MINKYALTNQTGLLIWDFDLQYRHLSEGKQSLVLHLLEAHPKIDEAMLLLAVNVTISNDHVGTFGTGPHREINQAEVPQRGHFAQD